MTGPRAHICPWPFSHFSPESRLEILPRPFGYERATLTDRTVRRTANHVVWGSGPIAAIRALRRSSASRASLAAPLVAGIQSNSASNPRANSFAASKLCKWRTFIGLAFGLLTIFRHQGSRSASSERQASNRGKVVFGAPCQHCSFSCHFIFIFADHPII